MKNSLFIGFGAVLVVLGAIMPFTNIAYTLTLPKEYAGSVTLQVLFPENMADRYDGTALRVLTVTQAEVIGSIPILNQVIEDLKLQERWGKIYNDNEPLPMDLSRRLLKRGLTVKAIPKTAGLISIEVRSQDPEEAALIANTIARVYHEKVGETPQQGGEYKVTIINPAEVESIPVHPNVLRNIVTGMVMAGIVVVAGFALILLGSRSSGPRVAKPPPLRSPDTLE